MKVYNEKDWLAKEDADGMSLGITGMVIKEGVIASLGICHRKGGLTGYSIWYSKPGKKDYRLEDDGTVSKIEDCNEKVISKINSSNIVLKNKFVLPFSKWFKDFVPLYNSRHARREDHIKGISIDGLEVRRDGTVRELKVTMDYGTFKIDDVKVDETDILTFNYGISRDVLDSWRKHAYFNENYDLVFDADGQYCYNSGYNYDYFGKGKCGLESLGFGV
jgi:hypothetical protein